MKQSFLRTRSTSRDVLLASLQSIRVPHLMQRLFKNNKRGVYQGFMCFSVPEAAFLASFDASWDDFLIGTVSLLVFFAHN